MKISRGILNILVALTLGLVATFFIHRYVTSKTRTASQDLVPVIVAEASIAPGGALRPEILKVMQWPRGIVPAQTASAIKQVENRVVIVPLSKGEPILLSKLAPEGVAAGMVGLMRQDKLAVTIRTDDVTGVAGFLRPGEKVDVLVAMKMHGVDEYMSKILLQDVTVLTAGQKWEQTSDTKPQVVNTVTLELSPEEAEIINLGSQQGKIRLALRHQQNKIIVATAGISSSELLKGRNLPAPTQAAAPLLPKGRPGRTVQVIKGINVSATNFN